jgi:hypothetical protein
MILRAVPVILAEKVRLHPYSPHQRTICMRVEIYGCPAHGESFSSLRSHRIEGIFQEYLILILAQ